jgi:hypothetical protein
MRFAFMVDPQEGLPYIRMLELAQACRAGWFRSLRSI